MKKHIKKYFRIGAMLVAAVLFLYSCAARDEKSAMDNAPLAEQAVKQDSIAVEQGAELGLEAENLDREQLEVFTQRAKQKLKDLADYIAIISDSTYEKEFRYKAREQALELFGDTATVKQDTKLVPPGNAELYLSALVDEYPGRRLTLQFTGVKLAEFPERVKEDLYLGRLSFNSSVNSSAAKRGEVPVIIKKVPKKFGNETHQVWEVMLGEIK